MIFKHRGISYETGFEGRQWALVAVKFNDEDHVNVSFANNVKDEYRKEFDLKLNHGYDWFYHYYYSEEDKSWFYGGNKISESQ